MKSRKGILLVLACAFSIAATAGQEEYNECMLTYLKKTKVNLAAQFITVACDENFRRPSFTFSKRKAYNECILENLPGVESTRAAAEIRSICARKEF